jgi:hypothetical protein
MMTPRKLALLSMVTMAAALLSPHSAKALELSGAWATSPDQCSKVFTRKGRAKNIAFTTFSGVYGGGFIAEVDRLKGKHEICKIKSKKESDRTINLIAACANSVMLSHVQFILNVVDDNTISREFPGMVDMKVTYHRCQI